jgi:FdhE protein
MLWPTARPRRLDAEVEKRLSLARRNNPEAETWLALIEAALAETADAARWRVAIAHPAASPPARAPVLHGAEIAVDSRAVRRFVHRLASIALNGATPNRLDAVELVEAAICQDDARIDTFATGDPSTLRVIAQIAAIPLLVAAARTIGAAVSPAWWEGYCPVCGAWPTLAEFRGLERKRWLRCGRCATSWETPWLRCPFCGEAHHEHLGYLAPEDGETSRKVELCDTCKGYLKAQPTVSALPWWGVLLDDAATVALDVAALDRGYHRPDRPGFDLEVRIVAHRGGRGGRGLRGLWTT